MKEESGTVEQVRRDDEGAPTSAERGRRGWLHRWLRTANINLLLSLLAVPAAVWTAAGPEIYEWLFPASDAQMAEDIGNVLLPLCLTAGGALMIWRREAPAPNLGTIKGGAAAAMGWFFIILGVVVSAGGLAVAIQR